MTQAFDAIGVDYTKLRQPDPRIRAAMSSFWAMGDVPPQMGRLEQDLNNGAWYEKYGYLREERAIDLG